MNIEPTPISRRREITVALDRLAAAGHRDIHMTEQGDEMRRLRVELGALGGNWQHPTAAVAGDPKRAPGREDR